MNHESVYPWITRQSPIILGVCLWLFVFALVERHHATQRASYWLLISAELQDDLIGVRDRIDQRLNLLLFRNLGLVAYIQAKKGDLVQQDLNDFLAVLYEGSVHIRSFGVAENTTVRFVYPEEGDELILGRDYRELPQLWDQVLQAISSKSGVLALAKDGSGLVFRLPVRIQGEYWGLISMAIMDSFLLEMAADQTLSHRTLAIRAVDERKKKLMLYGDPTVFENSQAEAAVLLVPGGHWEVGLAPQTPLTVPVLDTLRVAGWLLAMLLGFGLNTILKQRQALAQLVLFDELTGIANRRQFDMLLQRFCDRYERKDSGRFVLVFLDLDGFKTVNDEFGHRAGDHLLKEIAKRAGNAIRTGDILCRWGGDEFAILLDNPSEKSVAEIVARIRRVVQEQVSWRGSEMQVGASIGIARYPQDGLTPEELLSISDKKMYADKELRRKCAEDKLSFGM